jgi:hypothetical protein
MGFSPKAVAKAIGFAQHSVRQLKLDSLSRFLSGAKDIPGTQ